MSFNFHILESVDGELFFRNMGVPVSDQDDPVVLLQAAHEYLGSLYHKPADVRQEARDLVDKAFYDVVGDTISNVSYKYDPNNGFDDINEGIYGKLAKFGKKLYKASDKISDSAVKSVTKAVKNSVDDIKADPKIRKSVKDIRKAYGDIKDAGPVGLGYAAAAYGGYKGYKYLKGDKSNSGIHDSVGGVDEDSSNMMPRKKFQADRSRMYNMKTADEIMQTTIESINAESFEIMSDPPTNTNVINQDDLITLGNEIDSDELKSIGGEYINDLVGGTFVSDPIGNVEYACEDDFTLDGDWFAEATQDFVDRSSTGECWKNIVHDLASRFAGFFDGSYQAFDFAAGAFTKRALDMGLIEQEMMVESFNQTGVFGNVTDIDATVSYRNHTFSLNPHDYNGVCIFRILR